MNQRNKDLREEILLILDEKDGDYDAQANGIIQFLIKEGVLEEDEDEMDYEDFEEKSFEDDSEW